jgi:hypothetical protein
MLQRRVFSEIDFVVSTDPAIDGGSHAAFAESGYDYSKLVFVENNPTVFRLKPMTYRQRCALNEKDVVFKRAELAIKCGLVGVKDYKIIKPDGTEYMLRSPDVENVPGLGAVVTDAWLEEAGFSTGVLYELGGAVIGISELSRPLVKP